MRDRAVACKTQSRQGERVVTIVDKAAPATSLNRGVAVVTGAASGIGAGLAREAARRGMHVVLADRDGDGLAAVAGEIGDAALTVRTDVADEESVERLAERAYAAFGRVDLLFNNAGVLSTGRIWEIEPAKWRQALDVNIMGVVHGLRAFVPRMIEAGTAARIVHTASVGGFLPSPMLSPYCATKFAVVALTEALAGELAAMGSPVKVSLLAPGPVKTEIFREKAPSSSQAFVEGMCDMLAQHGLAADAFARLVFQAIDRGDYWIIPQPEALDPALAARTGNILARREPTPFPMRTGEPG